jgi:hypothetical protein
MHFYWRIIEELKFLGEIVVFKDPNLLRCYKFWLEEHADAITLSTTGDIASPSAPFNYKGISPSLN